ncbi:diguanylate cyclase (GGDEF) domain protein [Acididesulfobacillus acetoxydans]|uniref:Diguanylate cyclase (GGDEF) domain protein n=1 Tax=Acididesulfobacillus acetoxydans TaxID=1561005 RepID=A0A8S0XDA9_9FIRM|nr:GGDEF domain-containing protein [Acididesulfobacillus acetoxydans]CAA7603326.1 diguanylate cyclase (GGDEF) domain protein [Acididesulfobacillus acetoxydans]CEJ09669.1 Predicted signal transduction protein [Acididesulfobacillus acetoxydans]
MINIKRVANIYSKEFPAVDFLDGVSKSRSFLLKTGTSCCLVMDGGNLVGVITYKELLRAHPNRIIADVMCRELVTVPADMPLWQAQEVFEGTGLEVLLVQEDGELSGVLPRNLLEKHLGPHTDLLTGLYKSDYIYYHGVRLLENKQEISIAFFDINKFGIIDKTYGHTVGDVILIEVSRLLKDNIPAEAFLCRFGGDEFAVLLPAHLDEAVTFAYRLADIVDRHSFSHGIAISISAGVIGGRRHEERVDDPWDTMEKLMNVASLRSTEAKNSNATLLMTEIQGTNEIA